MSESALETPAKLLRWSIAFRYIWSRLCTALMCAILGLTPLGVQNGCSYVLGDEDIANPVVQNLFEGYWIFAASAFILSIVLHELGGYQINKRREGSDEREYVVLQERISRLSAKAGLSYTPTAILLTKEMSVGATHSFLFGRKILFSRRLMPFLTSSQLDVVLAHELTHLANKDVRSRFISQAGFYLFGFLKWALVVMFFWNVFASSLTIDESIYVVLAIVTLWLVQIVYKLLAAATSRAREYLADMGSVRLLGWERRYDLISSLIQHQHAAAGGSPMRIFMQEMSWSLSARIPLSGVGHGRSTLRESPDVAESILT